MIDKLVLRCPFRRTHCGLGDYRWPDFQLAALGVPLEQSIDRDGQVFNTRHPWESIPSSYESMAFKIFDHRYDPLDKFFIEIKASPAKIMQGHNIFGSLDFYDCCFSLIELLYTTYPVLAECLDGELWELAQIDLTFSSRARDNREAKAFINALCNVSYGQTKARTGFDGTAYFGKKNSRIKKIKVYAKEPEVLQTIKRNDNKTDGALLNEVYTPDLIAFSTGLIRWEASLYTRWFERHLQQTDLTLRTLFKTNFLNPITLQLLWQSATTDLFKALEGQTMKLINDDEIHQVLRAKFSKTSEKTGKVSTARADAAFRMYRDIRRDGWLNTKESFKKDTFYRHVKMLCECGISRAALQNMTGLDDGAQIIPFVRFIQVDFGAQHPDWYTPPPPKHVYHPQQTEDTKPKLSLVVNH